MAACCFWKMLSFRRLASYFVCPHCQRRALSTTSKINSPREVGAKYLRARDVVNTRSYEEIQVEKSDVDPKEKWGFLFESKEKNLEEKFYRTHYGSIRLDSDNVAEVHGQYDVEDTVQETIPRVGANFGLETSLLHEQQQKKKSPAKGSEHNEGMNYFDEVTYGDSYRKYTLTSSPAAPAEITEESQKNLDESVKDDSLNYFDQISYGAAFQKYTATSSARESKSIQESQQTTDSSDLNYFDEVLFGNEVENLAPSSEPSPKDHKADNFETANDQDKDYNFKTTRTTETVVEISERKQTVEKEFGRTLTRLEEKQKMRVKPNFEKPETAFDYVMKLRRDKKIEEHTVKDPNTGLSVSFTHKVDSKGYRVLDDQTPKWHKIPSEIVLQTLKDSILYDKYDILALYKPYGLAIHDSTNLSAHKITDFLPQLAKIFKAERLYTVHRLDKETTGVLLLAKTQRMADVLNSLFKEHQVQKTYWGITKNVPSPREGIIDIPIAEGEINNIKRMVLRPDYQEAGLAKKSNTGEAQRALTHYKTLISQGNGALVELKPETGVHHQLRVHLAFGLNCPILGDHKYSHLTKMAPQKLPGDMLDKLRVRQSKVRTVPMHLHSKLLVLPELADGKDIWISAKLPKFFVTNMNQLKLKVN